MYINKYFYILLFCLASCIIACHHRLAPQNASFNREVTDSQGNLQLVGKCTRERLEQDPYRGWFAKGYAEYRVDSSVAGLLKDRLAGKQFTVFMGTWCGDSQREVPRIFKMLDCCGIPSSTVRLIMVSEDDSIYKQSPGHEEKGLGIFRVPDLIVYSEGRELGRIVESPIASLEKDLLSITGPGDYTPQYGGANYLVKVFRQESLNNIENELPGLASQIKPLVGSPSELKGYARVLQTGGEREKAAIALKLNALIFPAGK
jgi:hypothetical protein